MSQITYRDQLQALIRDTWGVYEQASPLRDFATGEEKDAFNSFRGKVNEAVQSLIQLDDRMDRKRADTLW